MDSHFNSEAHKSTVDYITVLINMLRGAPTIQANISGKERTLIIDMGSNICLVQPGVHPGTVRMANLSMIGVTGDALHI
jgi:hypothetical protein